MRWPVMIFAAGFGTRMGQLTQDRPKPMIEVAGRPLIDHALDLAEALPADPIAINLHYKPEPLATHLKNRAVRLILEKPDILDTGGGLRNALPVLGKDEVMTLNSDAVWSGPNPLTLLAETWEPERMDGLLMCVPLARTHGHDGGGDFTADTEGQIRRGSGLVYGGAQIIKTERLHEIGEQVFSLNVLWNLLLAQNRLYCVQYPGHWCDVGHPGGIALAEKMLKFPHV